MCVEHNWLIEKNCKTKLIKVLIQAKLKYFLEKFVCNLIENKPCNYCLWALFLPRL